MKKTVVVGFGNLLMGDDGVGIRVVQELRQHPLPAHVEIVDGGLASLEVLAAVHGADRLVLVDALTGSGVPGDIYRLTLEDLETPPSAPVYSLHEFTLADALYLMQKTGALPPTTIYGIEPASTDMSLELTPAVAIAAEKLVQVICSETQGATNA